ncbi:MAG: PQQ-dependent sugar dehydrogenase [Patescibacteria group bacterium]
MKQLISCVLALGLMVTHAPVAAAAVSADGALVKAVDGIQVYLLENGTKRWVSSEEAFVAHGFAWNDIQTVSSFELDIYAEGEDVTTFSVIDVPATHDLLPDLIPLPADDISFSQINGADVLRFSGLFWNNGPGTLRLRVNKDTSESYQLVDQVAGGVRERLAGEVEYHDIHYHYHLDDFGTYILQSAEVENVASSSQAKVSFCMRDNSVYDSTLPNAAPYAEFTSCSNVTQGVSVGWIDEYSYTLPDQYLALAGLESGVYQLIFAVDPTGILEEQRIANNRSVTLIDLDMEARSFEVLASITPNVGSRQQLDDNLLLKGDRSDRVYLTYDGKKRLLLNDELLSVYGHAADDILQIPEEALQSVPDTQFIRDSSGAIYMLNQYGYVRRILNPEVLGSYTTGNIPVIADAELATYKTTEFIKPEGDDRVYSINEKQLVGHEGKLSQLAIDQRAVQTVNKTDLRSYAVATVATKLDVPWDIAFLPDGDMLVTERTGYLNRFGAVNAHIKVPGALEYGEAGLLGIAVHPNFAENQYIYLYYSTQTGGTSNQVVRFRLDGDTLIRDKTILDNIPGAIYHDGGQLAFGPDGLLYISAGDASDSSKAQDLASLAGKTLRLTADGEIPPGNPFATAVYSYGHRNVQGLAWDESGNLWEVEHGPTGAESGYDEVNLVQSGGNYGWPLVKGDQQRAGLTGPKLNSGPNQQDTWAPAGLAYADGKLYYTGLYGSQLYVVTLAGEHIQRVDDYFEDVYGRLRAATIGPDGMLYISTSNRDGRGSPASTHDLVLKIAPGLLEAL